MQTYRGSNIYNIIDDMHVTISKHLPVATDIFKNSKHAHIQRRYLKLITMHFGDVCKIQKFCYLQC